MAAACLPTTLLKLGQGEAAWATLACLSAPSSWRTGGGDRYCCHSAGQRGGLERRPAVSQRRLDPPVSLRTPARFPCKLATTEFTNLRASSY
jgi:hypothetical protein